MSNNLNPKLAVKEATRSTFSFIKDFSKVMVFEGREKAAAGLEALADKIDTTPEQKQWKEDTKKEFERLRLQKELKSAKPAGAKA